VFLLQIPLPEIGLQSLFQQANIIQLLYLPQSKTSQNPALPILLREVIKWRYVVDVIEKRINK